MTIQHCVYILGQKMAQIVLNTLTLSNINRFSKFFHCQNQEKICNNIITKDPTTPQVCRCSVCLGIDSEFERLLDAIFGVDTMKAFRRKRPADWICLQAAFESRKRAANPQSPSPLNIPLPFSFIEFYRKHTVSDPLIMHTLRFVSL